MAQLTSLDLGSELSLRRTLAAPVMRTDGVCAAPTGGADQRTALSLDLGSAFAAPHACSPLLHTGVVCVERAAAIVRGVHRTAGFRAESV